MTNQNPFAGQLMRCIVCDRQQQSDPTVESEWRCIQIENDLFYACPNEFPPSGSEQDFKEAYEIVIACALSDMTARKTGVGTIDQLEMYRASRRIAEKKRANKPQGFGGNNG